MIILFVRSQCSIWVGYDNAGTGRIELFLIYAVGTCSFLAHEDDRWWFLCLRLFAV